MWHKCHHSSSIQIQKFVAGELICIMTFNILITITLKMKNKRKEDHRSLNLRIVSLFIQSIAIISSTKITTLRSVESLPCNLIIDEGFLVNLSLFVLINSFTLLILYSSSKEMASSYFLLLSMLMIPKMEQKRVIGSFFDVKIVGSMRWKIWFFSSFESMPLKKEKKEEYQLGFVSEDSLISLHLQVRKKKSYSSDSNDT